MGLKNAKMYLIDLEKIYESSEFDPACNRLKELIEKGIRKTICRHCGEAPCAQVCPQNALKKENEDLKRSNFLCTGCRTCLMACPFGVNIDEITEYKTSPSEELETLIKKCPYIEEGRFEESEEIIKIDENIFVKSVHWKKQIAL